MKNYLFGTSYYPEHWNEAVREGDPKLFAEANYNVVRMGEFAWSLLETEEGKLDFSLFDQTIESLAAKGIKTIFCTPTAAPPRWLSFKYPEILRADERGIPLEHGSRQHASHFSETFRQHSRRITRELAEHFAPNPNVIGWQTDNEFHCHFSEDHSQSAQHAFREFLKSRYDSIEELNTAWGTSFWSLDYQNFDQVETPKNNRPAASNPAHALDYYRFLNWGVTLFQREQVEILRKANPNWFVTHNGVFEHIDYHGDFCQDLDFLSYDSYPFFEHDPSKRPAFAAFSLDWTRAYAGNFVIMEHQSGPGGQGNYFHDNPEPGEIRKMAWTSVAHGADGVFLFRERSCRFGAEEFWCGVLDHDNIPRRRYYEVSQLGNELKAIAPKLLGSEVSVQIGIAGGDFVNDEAHLPLSLGLPKPKSVARILHRHFYENGYEVGIVHPQDLDNRIQTYFIPHYTYIDPEWIPIMEQFVRQGGSLIIGARSGTKDQNNNVIATSFPGALSELTGVSVEEYGAQNNPQARALPIRFGIFETPTSLWYESLSLSANTTAIGSWNARHLEGSPAISLRPLGKGKVVYLGTYFDEKLLPQLSLYLQSMDILCEPGFPKKPRQVEITSRQDDAHRYTFVINHGDRPIQFQPEHGLGTALLGYKNEQNEIELEPYDVAIFQSPQKLQES